MRRRRDRLRANDPTTSSTETSESSDDLLTLQLTPALAAEKMREHWFKGVRTVSTYTELLPLVREHLRTEASKTPALQLLRNFPALHLNEIVSYESRF